MVAYSSVIRQCPAVDKTFKVQGKKCSSAKALVQGERTSARTEHRTRCLLIVGKKRELRILATSTESDLQKTGSITEFSGSLPVFVWECVCC